MKRCGQFVVQPHGVAGDAVAGEGQAGGARPGYGQVYWRYGVAEQMIEQVHGQHHALVGGPALLFVQGQPALAGEVVTTAPGFFQQTLQALGILETQVYALAASGLMVWVASPASTTRFR